MKIDLFEFARLHGEASGRLALTDMPRIDTPDRSGAMAWKAVVGSGPRRALAQLDLDIDGTIELVCQRCLQSMQQEIAIRSHFLIAPNEEAAAALDDDDAYDAIVGAADFDLDALIEDEVILALPIAPRHGVCPDAKANLPYRDKEPSAFAALAALAALKSAPRGDDDGTGGDR